jgi:DNA-binding XRE family transcriptional regulator
MTCPLTVAALRAEMELTLAQMGELIGLSKSQMHEVESTNRASLKVALAIEALSVIEGKPRIDAGALNEDVRLSRDGMVVHEGRIDDAA